MRDSLAVGDVTLEVAVGPETPAASCIKTTYRIALHKVGGDTYSFKSSIPTRSRKHMRRHISFSVVAITLSLVVACVDHRPGSVDVLKDQSGESNQLPSAERASPEEQYQLGMRHEKGIAMPQSYSEAVRWYRLSAMQGNSDAQYKLCELSERGQGLPQDYQEALRWCGLAADQG